MKSKGATILTEKSIAIHVVSPTYHVHVRRTCISQVFYPKFKVFLCPSLWREISVKIMVYCLNLVMVYPLHSGGGEIPFWCGRH